uniref:cyclin-dependent kinase n=1 Tax=Panagrellus redivivus TaxID=6233 RepID=A0A7E4UM17_PANRE
MENMPHASTLNTLNLADFEQGSKIGEGTYGTVHSATIRGTNEKVALKQIKINADLEGVPSTCMREVTLLKELNHPNVVVLHDVIIQRSEKLYLVFEFIDQDLKMLLDKLRPNRLPMGYVKSFMQQLLNGLAYCHSHRVVHRDLKPQNLLVTNDGVIKLADFGLARAFSIPSRCYTHEVVTMWYRAPEVLLGTKMYSTGIDMWSLGCIFAECVKSDPLFDGDCEIDQLYKIFQLLGTPDDTTWPNVSKLPDYNMSFPKWPKKDLARVLVGMPEDGLAFIKEMFIYPPMYRITAKNALSHRFLRDVPRRLAPIPSLYKLKDGASSSTKRKSDGDPFGDDDSLAKRRN